MQFTTIALILASIGLSSVLAMPQRLPADYALDKRQAGCQALACAETLAPTVAACATAVAQLGADPISDGSCLVAAFESIGPNLPVQCNGCAAKFGVSAVSAAKKVEGGAVKAEQKAKGILKKIF